MTADRTLGLVGILCTLAAPALAQPPADVAHIKVPEGFVVQRVAGPPLVEHPMSACLDDRGRLFVAENAGVNLDFKQLQQDPPSRILMLEDTDRDGTFDKRTVFADKLTFPSGVLALGGAVYACSPPGLWRFEDGDGDGVAERREQIVTGFGSIGNAADLHGPYLGPEGWLYFCDGRNGHDVVLGDGTRWMGKAACLYRCRPDGSGLEVIFGGGFDNPVEVAFTPAGEPLVNVNLLHAQPHRVDAILYGIEGGNYPYEHAWRELKRTGDFLPAAGDLGWVATSGFMRYRGHALGERNVGRYFSTEFNTRRVRSHVVEREGAGFRVAHEEFLASDDPDFRPTDVLEDADGSLLVVDTGGWFRIGCPQSQVAKPDVKGAIYRVRRARGDAGARVDPPLEPAERRIAHVRLASLRGDAQPVAELVRRLTDESLAVRREAATALGRLRAREAVGPLLDAAASTGADAFLDHAITFALVRIADADATAAGLRHASPAARRVALVALDQMDGGKISPAAVVPHLASAFAPLREAALGIAAAHPSWAEQVVPLIRSAASADGSDAAPAELRTAVVAFARAAPVQAVVAELLASERTGAAARRTLLLALAESGVNPLPEVFHKAVCAALAHEDAETVQVAVDVIRTTGAEGLHDELLAFARDARRPADLRVAALAAVLPRAAAATEADFRLLLAELAPDRPPLARRAAAQAVARAPLDEAQRRELVHALAGAGPLEMPVLLSAFERSADPQTGEALVRALLSLRGLPGVTSAALSQALAKYPPPVRAAAAPLLERLNPNAAAQAARLAELAPLLAGGDASRGQSVFFGKAAACATCHAVRGTGAHVGPDLSKIASIRSGPDLIESLVFPSASFARGYESFVVQTKANDTHAGTLAAETAEAIVLRTPAEVRVPRASVKSMRQDRVSIMPEGLEGQISREELRDLLAFLQSLK